jgi:hypothetical protein
MIIGFLSNKLTLRGSEIALYDYAHYNEILLGNKSIIISRSYNDVCHERDSSSDAYKKFNDRFRVAYYKTQKDIDGIVQTHSIDVLYIIKGGHYNDEIYTTVSTCRNLIHLGFSNQYIVPSNITNLSVAIVSPLINKRWGCNYKWLPHIITVADDSSDLRTVLSIPGDAKVFGTYSGSDRNVDYILKTVCDIVMRPVNNIYFIFMNIQPFIQSPFVKFLNGTTDNIVKRRFINTCDAMLYSREQGETFGLAIGEFSLCKKPIICKSNAQDDYHLTLLGNSCLRHSNQLELEDILINFDTRVRTVDINDNKYISDFSPERVMKIFNECVNISVNKNNLPFAIVTGFWDIKRDQWGTYYKRSMDKYMNNFKRVCTLKNDMIVYADPLYFSTIYQIVKEYKQSGKWIVIPYEYEKLDGYKYEPIIRKIMSLNSFKQGLAEKDVPEVICPEYDVVIWSKVSMLKKVLIDNPLNCRSTFGVMWLDFGIHEHMFPDKYLNTLLFDGVLKTDKVRMMYRSLPQQCDLDIASFFKAHRNRLTAPMICGGKENIFRLYEYEQGVIQDALDLHVVDCEQSVHAVVYLRHPEIFDLFPGDWTDVLLNY